MKLNFVEQALVNSRARAYAQRRYEAPLLERLGGLVTGGRVLEVGCGRGWGRRSYSSDSAREKSTPSTSTRAWFTKRDDG